MVPGNCESGAALEVAEVDAAVGRVVRVRVLHEVRIERELLAVGRLVRVPGRRPVHDSAERAFEVLDRAHRDRVDHLLTELRTAVGRGQAVLGEHLGRVEVDRRKQRRAFFVLVDDEDVLARGSRLELFPGNPQGRLVHDRGLEARGHAGVDREHAQVPKDGPRS